MRTYVCIYRERLVRRYRAGSPYRQDPIYIRRVQWFAKPTLAPCVYIHETQSQIFEAQTRRIAQISIVRGREDERKKRAYKGELRGHCRFCGPHACMCILPERESLVYGEREMIAAKPMRIFRTRVVI